MCDATSGIMANVNTDGLRTGDCQGPARSGEPRQQAAPYALDAAGRLLHPTRFLMGNGPIPEVTLLVEQPNSSCRSKDGQDSAKCWLPSTNESTITHLHEQPRFKLCFHANASVWLQFRMFDWGLALPLMNLHSL